MRRPRLSAEESRTLKLGIFFVAGALFIMGALTGRDGLVLVAIVLLLGGVALRWLGSSGEDA
jgi:hypothetical protein